MFGPNRGTTLSTETESFPPPTPLPRPGSTETRIIPGEVPPTPVLSEGREAPRVEGPAPESQPPPTPSGRAPKRSTAGGFKADRVSLAPAPEIATDALLATIPDDAGAKVLGGVLLLRRLGTGGMGAVYLGHHAALDMPVAVKIMHAHLSGDEGSAERFVREAQVSAKIDHHNLVRTLHAGCEHGVYFLTMELVEGATAGQLLKEEGALSEERAVKIVLDATRGLAEAHRRGVVHRDVKPDNILIRREDGRGKLADLGLARALERTPSAAMKLTASGTTLGTPAYMAPEQIEAASEVGPAADVYSMGATLYELVCASPPFTAASISSLFQQILQNPPIDPAILRPGITRELRDLILRALEKSTERRFATAEELEKALESVLGVVSKERPTLPPQRSALAKSETAPLIPSTPATTANAAPPVTTPPPSGNAQTPTSSKLTPEEAAGQRYKIMATIRTVATVIVAAVVVWALVPASSIPGRSTLTIGLLPDRRVTTDRLKQMQPLVNLLQKATGRRVDLFIGGSYQENVDAFVEGRLSVAQFGGVTYVLAKDREPGAVPLVQRSDDKRFHSLFIAHSGSQLRKLEDLRGKRFAYVDPLSTSGYVVPAIALLDVGIDPRTAFSTVVFTGGHDATIESIATGQVDAGAVDERVYYQLLEQQRFDATQLRVVHRSPDFPDDVWVASPSLEPKIRDAVAKAFTSLDGSREADRMILWTLEAKKYVPARDADYDDLRAKVKVLQSKGALGGGS